MILKVENSYKTVLGATIMRLVYSWLGNFYILYFFLGGFILIFTIIPANFFLYLIVFIIWTIVYIWIIPIVVLIRYLLTSLKYGIKEYETVFEESSVGSRTRYAQLIFNKEQIELIRIRNRFLIVKLFSAGTFVLSLEKADVEIAKKFLVENGYNVRD